MSTTAVSTAELVEQGHALGLTWGRRPATVTAVTGTFSATVPGLLLDGDTAADAVVPATSLCGPLALGMRVIADVVPSPQGAPVLYVAGILGGPVTQAVADTSATSSITTETVVLTLPAVTFLAQGAYRVRAGAAIIAATTTFAQYALRVGSLAGSVIGQSGYTAGAALAAASKEWTAYVRNSGSSAVTTDVVLTLTSGVGAIHYGDATKPRYLEITYAGAAADHPHAVTLP